MSHNALFITLAVCIVFIAVDAVNMKRVLKVAVSGECRRLLEGRSVFVHY